MSIKKHIPNAITCCNLFCGVLAIVEASYQMFTQALLLLLLAALFDFFDGFAARVLKAYSPLGKELDSLADMVSFGVAPSIAGFFFIRSAAPFSVMRAEFFAHSSNPTLSVWVFLILSIIPFFIAVFSALRLAKFNNDTRQSENFIGLATPACAILYLSTIVLLTRYCNEQCGFFIAIRWQNWAMALLALLLSWLLVSNIPMFSMKLKNLSWADNRIRFIYVAIVVVEAIMTAFAGLNFIVWIFASLATYILLNILIALSGKRLRPESLDANNY